MLYYTHTDRIREASRKATENKCREGTEMPAFSLSERRKERRGTPSATVRRGFRKGTTVKYDITRPATKGAIRVLNTVTWAFLGLLTEKSFDGITVNEICERAGYPRATFYNYFNDKYDLLNYLWFRMTAEIEQQSFDDVAPDDYLLVYFDRLYSLFERMEEKLRRILKKNLGDSYLISSMRIYLNTQIMSFFEDSPLATGRPIPREIIAEHYANTIYMIFEWRFLKQNICSREETFAYATYLLRNI